MLPKKPISEHQKELVECSAEIKKLVKTNKILEQKIKNLEQKARNNELRNKQVRSELNALNIVMEYLTNYVNVIRRKG